MPIDTQQFERKRLAVFARNGFDGEGRRIVGSDGQESYAIERGAGQGPCPTLLLHGGLSEASEWATVAGRLHGHVLVVDRPGCGLSCRADYGGVDYRAAAADWLLGLVDALGAERVNLVGNSMGGFFSMAFATAHPERARRLALVGAPAGIDTWIPLFLRLWGNPVAGQVVGRLPMRDPEQLRTRVFAPLLVAHAERVPREVLELAVAASRIPGTRRTAYTMLRACLTLRGWRRELMMRDDMARLDVPTLFAWGDADAFAPPSSGRELCERMPDARLATIADAGHLPYLDRPDAVAAIVDAFLDGDARPPAAVGATAGTDSQRRENGAT